MIFLTVDGATALGIALREKLTANRSYYVRTDGNDNNTGLVNDSSGAFLTIQKAINTALTLDFFGFGVTINVGSGTYTVGGSITSLNQTGSLSIVGNNTTPASVVISASTGSCFSAYNCKTPITFSGFDLRNTSGNAVYNAASWVTVGPMIYGAATGGGHLWTVYGGQTWCSSNYTINGSATFHVVCQFQSYTQIANNTVTLSGTPAFTQFINIYHMGFMISTGTTWSGAATGTRYVVGLNAAVYVGGAGANYFPGNVAGSTGSGGQYA